MGAHTEWQWKRKAREFVSDHERMHWFFAHAADVVLIALGAAILVVVANGWYFR